MFAFPLPSSFFFFLNNNCFFFFFVFFFFKVPEPVSEIQVIAKPNLAVISWGIPERANYYKSSFGYPRYAGSN